MYDRNVSVQLQAQAEQDLAEFFEVMVSERNPCFDEVGNHKFFWDEGSKRTMPRWSCPPTAQDRCIRLARSACDFAASSNRS